MKIELLQENFIKGLVSVSRSVSTKPVIPVLSHVLFRATKTGVILLATNLETGIKYVISSKVEEGGEISIPAKVILEYVSMLPAGKIILSSAETTLSVKCGDFEANIDGMGASEFPKLPDFPKQGLLGFSKKDFSRAMALICFAAATDEGRPVLTGVKTSIKDGEVVFAATDGYRLSVLRLKIPKGKTKIEREESMVIPARSLLEVSRIVNETEEKGELLFALTEEKNQAIFAVGESELSTRLIEGTFPNFEKIIPSSFKTKVEISTDGLLKAVRATSVFARDSANIIKIAVLEKSGEVNVSANAPQVGNNIARVDASVSGQGVEVAFNSRFLIEFLANLNAKTIEFSTEGSLNPGVFKIVGEDDFLHIIMPVRVQ